MGNQIYLTPSDKIVAMADTESVSETEEEEAEAEHESSDQSESSLPSPSYVPISTYTSSNLQPTIRTDPTLPDQDARDILKKGVNDEILDFYLGMYIYL